MTKKNIKNGSHAIRRKHMKSLANEVLDQTNTYYDIQERIGRRFEGLGVMLTAMQEIAGAVQYLKWEKYHTAV